MRVNVVKQIMPVRALKRFVGAGGAIPPFPIHSSKTNNARQGIETVAVPFWMKHVGNGSKTNNARQGIETLVLAPDVIRGK